MIRDRGFTLLEVLIAIGLMALLGIMSWRGLDAVLQSRDRLESAAEELSALSISFTQMEEDLRRAWPVRLLNLPTPPIGFSVPTEGSTVPALQLLREPSLGGTPGTVQRVVWRLRGATLERGFTVWASPGQDTSLAPATSPGAGGALAAAGAGLVWQPVLQGVRDVRMRGFVLGIGWIDAGLLAARPMMNSLPLAPGVPPSVAGSGPALVSGLELVIERGSGERYTRIFAIRD